MDDVKRLAALIREVDRSHDLTSTEIAREIVGSAWFRNSLRNAFDEGVSTAGRYGHEDYWDSDNDPYAENPWIDG